MNILCKKLEETGCDIAGAMKRFLEDEDLYCSCLKEVLTDENFNILKEGIAKKDMEVAFQAAHTLKGVLGNMGLTPLYNIVIKMVEILRSNRWDNVPMLYDDLMEQFLIVKDIYESNPL